MWRTSLETFDQVEEKIGNDKKPPFHMKDGDDNSLQVAEYIEKSFKNQKFSLVWSVT